MGNKQYLLIGRLLYLTNPEKASELLAPYLEAPGTIQINQERIPEFFLQFCDLNKIDPDAHRGKLSKTIKVDLRRLFISAMLHVYCPQVYCQSIKKLKMPKGIVTALSRELQVDPPLVSIIIRETIMHEKIYEDYRTRAIEITEQLALKS
ncbi:MAG: hypothetical protein ABIT05_01315 [Chitinophagaceae bacterium]